MSYGMYMAIERDKQLKAIDRYRRANVKSVEEAEKIEKKYFDQYNENGGEKNKRLMYWSRSVALGAKLVHGKATRWVQIPKDDEYEHQDKLEAMGFDV
jgi:uncharacterized metal-binding protein